MQSRKARTALAISALALGTIMGPVVFARAPVAGIVGSAASSTSPECPNLVWRLARHEDGKVTGIVYYSDLSGTSSANGSVDKSGKFHLVVTPAMGNGPSGVVDGQRSPNGKVVAEMKGKGCANMHVEMNPVADIAAYTAGGGGG